MTAQPNSRADAIIRDARTAQAFLAEAGQHVHANAIQRLIVARATSQGLNSSLTRDYRALRALLDRARDAMERREPDGISDEAWASLLAEIAAALGDPVPGATR